MCTPDAVITNLNLFQNHFASILKAQLIRHWCEKYQMQVSPTCKEHTPKIAKWKCSSSQGERELQLSADSLGNNFVGYFAFEKAREFQFSLRI